MIYLCDVNWRTLSASPVAIMTPNHSHEALKVRESVEAGISQEKRSPVCAEVPKNLSELCTSV